MIDCRLVTRHAARRGQSAFDRERLPIDDPEVDRLCDDERLSLARHWRRRARSETTVGVAFGLMVPLLQEARAHPEVIALMSRSSDDERRHAEICLALAKRYAGSEIDALPPQATTLPRFGTRDERLELALLVSGTCCINETLGTAWLELALGSANTKLTRAAHRAHLRDEIDHARLGWAHLASNAMTPALREALASYVPRLIEANLPLWLRPDPDLPVAGVTDHGAPSLGATRATIEAALSQIVLPGFRYVGIPVE